VALANIDLVAGMKRKKKKALI